MSLNLLLWLLSFVLCISNGVSVAPGDFDDECLDVMTRIPVSPNEKVVLDTQDYQSQNLISFEGESNIWKSVDFDGVDMGGTYNQVSLELYASEHCMKHNYLGVLVQFQHWGKTYLIMYFLYYEFKECKYEL